MYNGGCSLPKNDLGFGANLNPFEAKHNEYQPLKQISKFRKRIYSLPFSFKTTMDWASCFIIPFLSTLVMFASHVN